MDVENSKYICRLFDKFDTHGENYIKVNYVNLGTSKVNRMNTLIEVSCFFVNGITKSVYGEFSGTRYVYTGEKILKIY